MFIDRLTEEGQRPLADDLAKLVRRFQEARSEGSIPNDQQMAEQIAMWEKKYC